MLMKNYPIHCTVKHKVGRQSTHQVDHVTYHSEHVYHYVKLLWKKYLNKENAIRLPFCWTSCVAQIARIVIVFVVECACRASITNLRLCVPEKALKTQT